MTDHTHPEHPVMQESAPGVWTVSFPIHPKGWLGWKARRACHKAGGHWWHPADPMILWRCCQCGADRDGMPKDGSR